MSSDEPITSNENGPTPRPARTADELNQEGPIELLKQLIVLFTSETNLNIDVEKYKDVCLRPSELPVIADIIAKADTYEDINLMYQYVRYSERLLGALERMKRVVSAGENQLMKLNDIQCRDGCISIKMHRMY